MYPDVKKKSTCEVGMRVDTDLFRDHFQSAACCKAEREQINVAQVSYVSLYIC